MINIALIERNTIHRESLITLLEQVDGLQVVMEAPDGSWIDGFTGPPIHLLMLDGSMGKETCDDLIRQSSSLGLNVKILILVMFREELDYEFKAVSVLLKSSGKSEYVNAIRHMITDFIPENIHPIVNTLS